MQEVIRPERKVPRKKVERGNDNDTALALFQCWGNFCVTI